MIDRESIPRAPARTGSRKQTKCRRSPPSSTSYTFRRGSDSPLLFPSMAEEPPGLGCGRTGCSEDEAAQVLILRERFEPSAHLGPVDHDVFVRPLGGVEAEFLDHAFEDGMQPACPDIL